VVAHAELDAVICSGPRRGKQLTYALLDERVGPTKPRTREEALVELVRRYFTAHGPATVRDCVWWSGLRAADVQEGVAAAGGELERATIDGRTYWFADWHSPLRVPQPTVRLLPNYDEYLIAYRNRDVFFDPALHPKRDPMLIFANVVTVDGRVAGTWRRRIDKGGVVLEAKLSPRLDGHSRIALRTAAERYRHFIGVPVRLR